MAKKLSAKKILDDLISQFDKSGRTEVDTVVQLCKDHIVNETYDKDKINSSSLNLLDSILAELISAARDVRAVLHKKAGWPSNPRELVTLRCGHDEGKTMEAFIEISPAMIGLGFVGHGVCNMEPDTEIVAVEHVNEKPRVLVWANINQEDTTHIIDLGRAAQVNRKV